MARTMTLELAITINKECDTFDVDVHDPESGLSSHFIDIPCVPMNHETFDKNIGAEIYSWAALMMDEEE